ncbi:MAG: polysulfide reductase NrfD [Chloroflexi bacterium]|nr:polysulfide reductase NrfD [Chloroflexota bacterium]
MTTDSGALRAETARKGYAPSADAFRVGVLDRDKDAFVVGYNTQTEWAWLIATAFFLGKLGGGLFTVSLFLDSSPGMLIGILIVAVGKSAAHLLYLGRWERFWRAAMRPRTSWISRGLIAMGVMTVFGLLYLAPSFGIPIIAKGSAIWEVTRAIALAAAFVVMIYDGFVMSASPSIALWNTSVLPVLCLSYSLLGGATLALVMLSVTGTGALGVNTLEAMEISLIVANLVIVGSYISTMYTSTSSARQAAMMLVTGRYAAQFLGGAIFVGLVVFLMLALLFLSTQIVLILMLAALADLIGHFTIFFLLLRAGVFAPIV